jgi:predicted nucleotidyltransferase component of viral defense system
MIKLEEILSYYPKELYKFKQFIFKEYLQYLILKIIFESKYANKLSFLWWTNLRIVHNNTRFSEDLDFDNFWLENNDFIELSNIIKKELEKNWFQIEIKTIFKWAYRCSVKIPKLLKDLWFSNYEDEKILIQIDTAPHNFVYKPEVSILNRFWLVFSINTTPLDIITSQKIYAIFNRNRPKWRDFFDLVFLLSKSKPNLDYIKDKLGFSTLEETKNELLKFCDKLDFEDLTNDVEIFLFEESWKNNLKFFKEIIINTL